MSTCNIFLSPTKLTLAAAPPYLWSFWIIDISDQPLSFNTAFVNRLDSCV